MNWDIRISVRCNTYFYGDKCIYWVSMVQRFVANSTASVTASVTSAAASHVRPPIWQQGACVVAFIADSIAKYLACAVSVATITSTQFWPVVAPTAVLSRALLSAVMALCAARTASLAALVETVR